MRIRRSFAVPLALAAGVLALGACSAAAEQGAAGTWASTGPGAPTVTLVDDGTFSGTDGCNRISGSWEQEGSEVTFSDAITTLMACDGIPGSSGLAAGTTAGTAMTLTAEDGTELDVLTRQ